MTRKSLILLILLCINACNHECIDPGEGISSSNIKVEVPVVIKGADKLDKSTLWVDSGLDVKIDEKIPLNVFGTINLCADTRERIRNCSNRKLCNKVIVPSIFCSDGTKLNYSGESMDPSVVCAHASGSFSSFGWYIDSGIEVNPGDYVKFDLVPYKTIKVTDCYNIPDEVVNYSFADLEKIFLDVTKQQSLSNDNRTYIQGIINNKLPTICEQGLDFVEIPGSTDTSGNQLHFKLEKFKGKTYDVYVNNSFTPYGNKVFTQNNSFNVNNYWHEGALVDVRVELRGNEYDYNCNAPTDLNLKRFNTYDVNYRCNNLCGTSIWGNNCVSTLRYKWISGNDKCKTIRSDTTGLKKCKQLSFPIEKWADLLIAKIGDDKISYANDFGDRGEQCLPGNDTDSECMSFFGGDKSSLKLDYSYLILDNVDKKSKVWLGIADYAGNYADNIGGYHVEVKRSCVRAEGKDLYMYIGNGLPSVAPGDQGTDHIYVQPKDGDGNGIMESKMFVINGGNQNNGNTPKAGRVYFGIKDAIDSDTVKDNFVENPNNNKYVINIHRVVWDPIFSRFFTLIRDSILSVLYGSTGELSNVDINNSNGLVSATYNNIINNGLIQFVQALLVLFIAFSGISFMLGFMQRTQTELVIRVVKIGVVLAVISPSSWNLFGVTLFNLFVKGVDYIASVFSGFIGSDNSFAFLDPTIGSLLTKETWLRLLSIMFSGPIGFISFILLMWGTWTFLGAIITAVITYLMTLIGMSLLLILAPLFIIAILFKVTKTLFEGWIKMMLSMALTPIIMFSSLAFLHQLMMSAFFAINNFTACRGCAFRMEFDIGDVPVEFCPINTLVPTTYVSDYSLQDHMNQLYASSGENVLGLPFNLVAIIVFIISAFAIKAFIHIAENMAKDISGTMAPDFVSGSGATNSAIQGLLSLVGQDDATQDLRNKALNTNNVDSTRVQIQKRRGVRAGEDQEIRDKSINIGGKNDKLQDSAKTQDSLVRNASTSSPIVSDGGNTDKDQASSLSGISADHSGIDASSVTMGDVRPDSSRTESIAVDSEPRSSSDTMGAEHVLEIGENFDENQESSVNRSGIGESITVDNDVSAEETRREGSQEKITVDFTEDKDNEGENVSEVDKDDEK
ncbi:MAG: type IV secretion system protein [Rickettsiaceae bacterium H1]|nr:type IV secretion system protein [Rickettsiaceae bacterium H1]